MPLPSGQAGAVGADLCGGQFTLHETLHEKEGRARRPSYLSWGEMDPDARCQPLECALPYGRWSSQKVQEIIAMQNRRVISIALFVLAVLVLLVFGLLGRQWLAGVLMGLVLAIAGVIFYRRGK
jgi:hypothetical protein